MNIEIKNRDLTTFGLVSNFTSCEFTQGFNTYGSFIITINSTDAQAKYLQRDKLVYLSDDKIGYIDYAQNVTIKDLSNTVRVAKGHELKDRLDRLIYPAADKKPDSYTGEYIETIVKAIIKKNAGIEASGSRQIANLITAADQQRGSQVNYSAWLKDSIPEIFALLKIDGMGLKCNINFDEQKIVYDVLVGADKTKSETDSGGVLLDIKTSDILSITETDDRISFKNLSVTAGPGNTEDREIVEVGTIETGYDRREIYTDARDATSYDDIVTAGSLKVAETTKSFSAEVVYDMQGLFTFGEDFLLGDVISVKANTEIYNAQVTKSTTVYGPSNIPQIKLTLGFSQEEIRNAINTARQMDEATLKAAGSGNSRLAARYTFTDSVHSYVDIGGLTLTNNIGYDIRIIGASTVASEALLLGINNVDPSSYHGGHGEVWYNAAVSIASTSDSRIALLADYVSICTVALSMFNGLPIANGVTSLYGSAAAQRECLYTKVLTTGTEIDITDVRLEMKTGCFKEGTTILIFEWGK